MNKRLTNKAAVAAWKNASKVLEAVRRKELKTVDTMQALLKLADAFESCRLLSPLRPSSGLVAQQAYFMRLRQKGCD